MNKEKLVITFMVLVLIVLVVLVAITSVNTNIQRNENPNTTIALEVTSTVTVIPTPTFSPESTPTQTTTESIPTETNSHYVEYTSYTEDELSLMGISLDMNITDVEDLLGEPINIVEEYYVGISGYLLYYEYEFGGVEFYRSSDKSVKESNVNGVYIMANDINPLWGIEVGDSVEEVFGKLEIPYSLIEQRESRLSLNDKNIGRILYEHYSSNQVEMIEVYFGNIENYNSLYITFRDGEVIVFGISGPHLA